MPEVSEIDGLPPAVALQQQRGSPTTRSSVGSVTTLSNLLRMLYSRAGTYPAGQAASGRRIVFDQHPARSLSRMSRPGPGLYGDRAIDGSRRLADDSPAGRSPPGRPPGTARTCATSWSRSATTSIVPGASFRKRTATGSCSPTSSRSCRSIAASRPTKRGWRSSKGRAELSGHVHQCPAVRAAHFCQHAKSVDEEARRRSTCSAASVRLPRQAASPRVVVGHVRRPRYRRHVARCR